MFKLRHLPLAAGFSAVLFVAACTAPVGPQESGVQTPAEWSRVSDTQAVTPSPDVQVDQQWWSRFRDPTLNALIGEALANNKTLQIAKARVEEARANRTAARSSLFPSVDAAGSATRGNQGYATNNQAVGIATAQVEASWEFDLFGRNQARTAEATALLQSAQASQQAVRVGLLAELARNYFEMRNDERQIAITKANLETEKKTLSLIKVQQSGALASDFDVQRAAAQVSTTEAQIPALQTAYDAALNRLNVLLGAAPGTKDALITPPEPLQPLDQHILIAAPATVLAARPDVRVAERKFAASISARKAAVADLFPDISLTAFFGAQTATPFSSTPWGLGVNLVQPILNFGRIQSEIDAADSEQTQAFLTYQETVLEALENMQNALSGYMHETTRNVSLAAAVTQNQRAVDLANEQYASGTTGLLDVLVAERNLLDAQAAQAASDASLRTDLVNIYTAAGGGWKDGSS